MSSSSGASARGLNGQDVLATALYLDPDDSSRYPQLYDRSPVERIRIYAQCAAVALASARLTNPDADLRLIAGGPYDLSDLPDVLGLLSVFDIRVQHAGFGRYAPPPGRSKQFAGAFFKFSAVEILGSLPPGSRAVLFDSDCVWIAAASPMLSEIAPSQLGCYPLNALEDVPKGNPRWVGVEEAAAALAPGLGASGLTYFGGEFLAGATDIFETLGSHLAASMLHATHWSDSLDRATSVFDNDEFILSATLNLWKVEKAWNPRWIRRVHTNTRTFDSDRSDLDRVILHLPGEKRRGFKRIYDDLVRNVLAGGSSVSDDPRRWLRHLGVPRRSFASRMWYALPGVYSRLRAQ